MNRGVIKIRINDPLWIPWPPRFACRWQRCQLVKLTRPAGLCSPDKDGAAHQQPCQKKSRPAISYRPPRIVTSARQGWQSILFDIIPSPKSLLQEIFYLHWYHRLNDLIANESLNEGLRSLCCPHTLSRGKAGQFDMDNSYSPKDDFTRMTSSLLRQNVDISLFDS